MNFTLPAGRASFEITNASDRVLEWEILDGVMVVEERENIAPGFHAQLTTRLAPGVYEITCGLLSNPRGKLTILPSAASEAERIAPPITAFIGPLSEFKVYVTREARALETAAQILDEAIAARDIEAAKAAWLEARLPYKRIEAIIARFADLESRIDPLPEYLEKREEDAGFIGFHRLEYGLWTQGDIEALTPVSRQFVLDIAVLQLRVKEMKLAPADLAAFAARQADHLVRGQIASGENRWAKGNEAADLADIRAGLAGIEKASTLVHPFLVAAQPESAAAITNQLQKARDAVEAGESPQMATAFSTLAKALAEINPQIGLE